MMKIYNYWHCRKESIAEAKQCTELETEEQRVSLCPQLGQTQSTILLHNQSSLFMFYFRPNNHCQCFRGIFQLQYRMQNVEYKNHIGLGLRKVLKKVLKKALKKNLLTQKRTQKSKCTFLSTQKSTQ